MEKTPTPSVESVQEENATEKVAAERKLLDLLNKARQGHIEYGDVYSHVFGNGTNSSTEYPDFLIKRPDLLEKFAVGKNGEPYRSTHQAAHDLVDYLAEESEDVIREFEEKAAIERITKEIDVEKDLLEQLNKARQGHIEIGDIYGHVFGGQSMSGIKYPSFLVNREDLLEKFAVGKNGEPYQSTSEAAHDLVEFLAQETVEVIEDLESELSKYKKPKTKKASTTTTDEQTEETTATAEVETEIQTETKKAQTKEVVEEPEEAAKSEKQKGYSYVSEETPGGSFFSGIETDDEAEEPTPTEEKSSDTLIDDNTEIPFVIPNKLKLDLINLGMTDEEIDKLTPEEAWEVLKERVYNQQTKPESTEKPKPIEFTTAKGSVYTYLPDGRTVRFKKATNEKLEPQDVCVFLPPWTEINTKAQEIYPEIFVGIENEVQFEQVILPYAQLPGYSMKVCDKEGSELTTNADVAKADQIFVLFLDKKNPNKSFYLPASGEPKVGYSTFDTRVYEKDGKKMRSTHIGNKIVGIKYAL